MLFNPQIYLLITLVAAALFWLIPGRFHSLRQGVLVTFSAIIIMAVSPGGLILCVCVSVLAFLASLLLSKYRNVYLLWASVITLILPLLGTDLLVAPDNQTLMALGISFLTLKSLSVAIDSYYTGQSTPFVKVLLLNIFFPIFSAGPIERIKTFSREALTGKLSVLDPIEGLLRIALGIFKIHFIGMALLDPFISSVWPKVAEDPSGYAPAQLIVYIILRFFSLYISFSGFTDVAIGTGRIFGLNIMENFNYPVFAGNIQEFWRRWHISLGNFVINNIYFPFIRNTGWVGIPIIVTFLLVGLWHRLSWTYLIWGIAHGIGLALVQQLHRKGKGSPTYQKLTTFIPYRLACWLLTFSFISYMSAFANARSLEAGLNFTLALIGLG